MLLRLIKHYHLTSLACVLMLAGCATSYKVQMDRALQNVNAGQIDAAISALESSKVRGKDSLLRELELGSLLRMRGDYNDSRTTWLKADKAIREWENAVRRNSSQILGSVGSYVLNDSTRNYEGRDYEKVLLSVYLALDHLALGDWENARVEIKKMHEREAIIADFRAKEIESTKQAAREKGIKVSSYKELNGYPVETLDAPGVRALTNAYESAFANYLAGFVYEALNEPSLAAAGYRKAIELQPNIPQIEEALRGLDSRTTQRQAGVDTLFVVESGAAPAISSRQTTVFIPISSRAVSVSLSWPVLPPIPTPNVPRALNIDGLQQPLTLITNVDSMARRALADEMPMIMTRSIIRATTKAIAQKQVDDSTRNMGAAGILLSLGTTVAAIATESADERTWRTLPAYYSIGRSILNKGIHTLLINTPTGQKKFTIQLSGKYAVVVIRSIGNTLSVSTTPPL